MLWLRWWKVKKGVPLIYFAWLTCAHKWKKNPFWEAIFSFSLSLSITHTTYKPTLQHTQSLFHTHCLSFAHTLYLSHVLVRSLVYTEMHTSCLFLPLRYNHYLSNTNVHSLHAFSITTRTPTLKSVSVYHIHAHAFFLSVFLSHPG